MKSGTLQQMLEMLTSSYTREDLHGAQAGRPPGTNIGRLFSIFAWLADIARDTFETIRQWDDLDKAQGAALDRYGANTGVARDGTNDAIYRIMIKIKVLAQMSGGDVNTIITSAAGLLNLDHTDVRLEEHFPSKVLIAVPFDKLSEEHRQIIPVIYRALKRIVAAGVGYELDIEKLDECTVPCFAGIVPSYARQFTLSPGFPVPGPQELLIPAYATAALYCNRTYEIEVNAECPRI